MKRRMIMTEDGSHSLFVEDLGETYHSKHGAKQESVFIYINNGFQYITKDTLSVLEVGFGTALNAWLTYKCAVEQRKKVSYTGVEAFPLQKEEWSMLNYAASDEEQKMLTALHEAEWEKEVVLHPFFHLKKMKIEWEEFSTQERYDLIYYDAFGYDFQPEMWSKKLMETLYTILEPGGVMITYACKGVIIRTLKEVGFEVSKLDGPPGKRQITRAVKR